MRTSSAVSSWVWDLPKHPADAVSISDRSVVARVLLSAAVGLAVAAPWFVHVIPAQSQPVGPRLLPIFYAPLLAALLMRLPIAIAIGIAAPTFSRFLTEMPPTALIGTITVELVIFVVAVRFLRRFNWGIAGASAYLISLVATALVAAVVPSLTAVDVWATLSVAWPGVLIIGALGAIAQIATR